MHTDIFVRKYFRRLPLFVSALITVHTLSASAAVPQEEATDTAEHFFQTSSEILKEIRKASPEFYRQLTLSDKKERTKQLLTAISPAIVFEPESPLPSRGKTDSKYDPARMLPGKILYCRLTTLEPATFSLLQKDLKSISGQQKDLTGIILDLRNCSGGNPAEAQKDFSLFFPQNKEAAPFQVPILILTGPATQGAAEILAQLLEHTQYGLCMGEPTAGMPFPKQRIDTGEHTLYVPVIPKGMEMILPFAHRPAIQKQSQPQMSYEDIAGGKLPLKSDPCLSAARDLLLSLDTVRTRFSPKTGMK